MNKTIPLTMNIVYDRIDKTEWFITPQEVIRTSPLNATKLILSKSKYTTDDDRSVEQKFDILKRNMSEERKKDGKIHRKRRKLSGNS